MDTKFYVNDEGNCYNEYRNAIAYACKIASGDAAVKRIVFLVGSKSNTGLLEILFGKTMIDPLFRGTILTGCPVQAKIETVKTFAVNKYYDGCDIVICCALHAEEIFAIDDYLNVKYTIAIPWSKSRTQKWARIWNAKVISGLEDGNIRIPEPSEAVKLAFGALTKTINTSTGISHISDNRLAKTYIRALAKYEPDFDAEIVFSYLVRQLGWRTNHAQEVESLITKINSGKRFTGGETSNLKKYYDEWNKA